ncbi:MAG: hypothetical protein LUO82_02850 [Methanomicrobiales archaeon]|nr:hypothetical protein [Methanomicrobiales archaeon]
MADKFPLWPTVLFIVLIGIGIGIYLQFGGSSVRANTPTLNPPPALDDDPVITINPPPREITVPSAVPTFWPVPTPAPIPGARFPHIEPQDGGGVSTAQITSSFPFGRYGNATIAVPVNIAVYQGAKNADKNITLYSRISKETLLRTYYLSFIGDSFQDPFFESLLHELQAYRTQWQLNNDSYLELLTVFVQSIPYQEQEGGSRFPIETFVEYRGDCDDKALLLASLLAREGYNISILYFEDERHVALGIASSTMIYGSTGYAYLETTVPSLIGVPPATINGGDRIHSTLLILPVGSGTIRYERGDQVGRILKEEEAAYQGIQAALPDISIERTNLIDRIRSGELEEWYLSKHGEDEGYISFRHTLAVYCYIHTHPHDREGTYAWVMNGSPLQSVLCPQ